MTIKEKVDKILSNFKSIPFLIICITAIFIGIAYYVYHIYVKPTSEYKTNNEIMTEDDNNNKNVMLVILYADWCPHSKKVMNLGEKDDEGGWIKLKNNWNAENSDLKIINNYYLTLSEINESDKKAMDEFSTSYDKKLDTADFGFPSIFLIKDDQLIEFDANPTEENLIKFLNDVI